jgi:hypothetical protein
VLILKISLREAQRYNRNFIHATRQPSKLGAQRANVGQYKMKNAQLPPSATGILAVAGSGRPGRCGSTSARSYILEFKYTLFFFSKTETYFAILHGLEINLSMTDFVLESRNIPKGRKHI